MMQKMNVSAEIASRVLFSGHRSLCVRRSLSTGSPQQPSSCSFEIETGNKKDKRRHGKGRNNCSRRHRHIHPMTLISLDNGAVRHTHERFNVKLVRLQVGTSIVLKLDVS